MKSNIYQWLAIMFGVSAGSMLFQLAQIIGWGWPLVYTAATMLSLTFGHAAHDAKENR